MINKLIFSCFACCIFVISSCVTGNDDSAFLRDLEDQFAMTPRVTNLTINGVAPSRDQQSHWIPFMVNPGDVLAISATFESGNTASSSIFDISRTYYETHYDPDTAMPVEPLTEREMSFGSGSHAFNLSYTVPSMDDDGYLFATGEHINISFLSSNNLDGQGFDDINLEFE